MPRSPVAPDWHSNLKILATSCVAYLKCPRVSGTSGGRERWSAAARATVGTPSPTLTKNSCRGWLHESYAIKSYEIKSQAMRSWVEVSRTRIRENYRAVRALVGQTAEVMPVVKADAYRHGAIEISRVLESEGVRWLAVSNVDEGVALRS